MLGDEKVRKWRWEEVRTRDMAPSYKDPTVQESQRRPLHWQNKSTHRRRRKRRKRGVENEGKRGGGGESEKNGRSGIWHSRGPWTKQTVKHKVCFLFILSASFPQPSFPFPSLAPATFFFSPASLLVLLLYFPPPFAFSSASSSSGVR